jgi:uncharacterized protein (DUF4415 family)
MTERRRALGGDLKKTDARMAGEEYRDIPELTEADFDRGVWHKGGKPLRGRPKSINPKQLVSLRLDRDVIEHFRRRGPGWQRRINEALRKAARLKPVTAKRAIKGGSPRARP